MKFALTEDDNGHVRTTDFNELGGMDIKDFFSLLEIYEARIASRTEALKGNKNKPKAK